MCMLIKINRPKIGNRIEFLIRANPNNQCTYIHPLVIHCVFSFKLKTITTEQNEGRVEKKHAPTPTPTEIQISKAQFEYHQYNKHVYIIFSIFYIPLINVFPIPNNINERLSG